MNISDALDEFQLPFAQDNSRALRLLAPAGSGKTHSLLWRCLEQWETAAKTKPRFLLFTFTRAARDELQDRVRSTSEFSPISSSVEVMTLNSWGYRRLKSRMHSLKLITDSKDIFWAVNNNLQPVWSKHEKISELLTQTSSKNRTAKAVMAVMDGLKSLGFRHDIHHKAGAFVEHVEWLYEIGLDIHMNSLLQQLDDLQIIDLRRKRLPSSNRLQQIDDLQIRDLDISAWAGEIQRGFLGFWHEATISLKQMAMMTLEDQKYWAWLDLEESIEQKKFTTGIHRYSHILVDEFQDINCLDLRLLQSIATVNKSKLTLVGDDDQSIYEWRGASPRFILNPNDYVGSDYTTHILSRNYRSPENIVDLSQKLIRHNRRRVEKNVKAVSRKKADLDVWLMPKITDSIEYVANEVEEMLEDCSIKNVAIIGRKRSQIIPYQIEFASRNIPFYAAEDLQLFLSDAFGELKEMLGIKARAGMGPIPGMDPIQDFMKLVDKVKRFPLNKKDRSALLKHMQSFRPQSLGLCVLALRKYTGSLKGNNEDGNRANRFADAIQALVSTTTVSEAIEAISSHFAGLQKDYGKSLEDVFYTDPPFLHLAGFAERYGEDYNKFYEDINKTIATLARVPLDAEERESDKEPEWRLPLHLMTALRTKGKEFDAVVMLDVNQGIWPSRLAETEEQLEQERRVFYVAFTRVRKRLILLVNERFLGNPEQPSQYLGEMGLVAAPYSNPGCC